MKIPNLNINLTTSIGANLRNTTSDAIRIAKLLNIGVRFNFYDETLMVWLDTEIDDFLIKNKNRLGL